MRDVMQVQIVAVRSVTIRAVAGDGEQAELIIATKRGELSLRLIADRAGTIRVTDMRRKDKRKQVNILASVAPGDV